MVKKTFDIPLTQAELIAAQTIVDEAAQKDVSLILNVGTSLIESLNCIELAKRYKGIYAAVGIHPNDLTDSWKEDLKKLEALLSNDENKIVAIGECGIDKHYPGYDIMRQQDAFKAQIELALKHNKAIVVHTRDAPHETLQCLELYRNEPLRGTIHCFSEDLSFAKDTISWGFSLGIGGTVTYPKNEQLREVVKSVGLEHIILETDAPYLPPQIIRGRRNHPTSIALIAQYIARDLIGIDYELVAQMTTENARKQFRI